MTLGFLVAMEAEAKTILESSALIEKQSIGFATIYKLQYEGKAFFVIVSGIGKVLAGIGAATACIVHPEIDVLVNLGIGGSLDADKAPLLSAIVGSSFAQHDMDTTALGSPHGYLHGLDVCLIPGDSQTVALLRESCSALDLPICEGVIASGDKFLVKESDKEWVKKQFGALSIDMEGAAFAEACYVHHKPFAALRIVSDAVDHENEYWQYKEQACHRASLVGLELVKRCA